MDASSVLVLVVSGLMLMCATVTAQEPAAPTDRTLAVVNGATITERQLIWFMEQGWGGQILDEMITDLLLQQAAEEAGLKVTAGEVDAEVARVIAEYPSEQAFEHMLRDSGMTIKGLRIQLQRDLLIDKLIAQRTGIDEQGLRQYYEAHRGEFATPPRVHLFDIVTLSLEDAYAARERLVASEAFSTVASEMSQDPTAKQGGDRGWITPEDVLEPTVRDVVFRMQLGEMSDPVQCEDHCHIFYAKALDPGRQLTFEEARSEVAETLRAKRGISRELYLSLLKQRASIDVRWKPHSYLNEVYRDLSTVKVVVRGERLSLPRPAQLLPNSNLLVPAAAVLQAIGAAVQWDGVARTLTATRDGLQVRLIAGSRTLQVGARELQMKEAPVVFDGVLMMSPRAPIEALGGGVLWNRADNTLYVEARSGPPRPEMPGDIPPPLVPPGGDYD